jgi:hypothetical protein
VLVEGVSRRQILRETGMHRQTLKKILEQNNLLVLGLGDFRQRQNFRPSDPELIGRLATVS